MGWELASPPALGAAGEGGSARSTWELEGGGGGTQAGPGGRVPKGWTRQLPGEQGGPGLEEACLPGFNAWWGDPSFPGDGAVPAAVEKDSPQ